MSWQPHNGRVSRLVTHHESFCWIFVMRFRSVGHCPLTIQFRNERIVSCNRPELPAGRCGSGMTVLGDKLPPLIDRSWHGKHRRQIVARPVEGDVGIGANAELSLLGQAGNPRGSGPGDDAEFLEGIFAVKVG